MKPGKPPQPPASPRKPSENNKRNRRPEGSKSAENRLIFASLWLLAHKPHA